MCQIINVESSPFLFYIIVIEKILANRVITSYFKTLFFHDYNNND